MKLLSMEDAPQASLGGKKIAVTCKKCNNTSGYQSDVHLAKYINHLENKSNLPGTKKHVKILDNENTIRGRLEISQHNELSIILSEKDNNPTALYNHLAGVKQGTIITLEDKSLNVDWRRMTTAIIKNAYIILFARFGYSFLLDPFYDRLRKQIQHPDIPILPEALWTMQSKIHISEGVYLSNSNEYRGFFIVYSLSKLTKHNICVCIPTPLFPYEMMDEYFRQYKAGTPLHMFDCKGVNFLENLARIRSLLKWVYGWKIL